MQYATPAQAEAAGFGAVTNTAGVAYTNLYCHRSFPGVLFRIVGPSDDSSLLRGFARICTDKTITVGTGRYRTAVTGGTIGVFQAMLRKNGNAPGFAPVNMGAYDAKLMAEADYGIRKEAFPLADDSNVYIGVISPVGEILGIHMGSEFTSKLNQTDSASSTCFNMKAGVQYGQPPTWASAMVDAWPVVSASATAYMKVDVEIDMVEKTMETAVVAALRRLADALPTGLPQEKVDRWLELAQAAYVELPPVIAKYKLSPPKMQVTLVAVDGVVRGGNSQPTVSMTPGNASLLYKSNDTDAFNTPGSGVPWPDDPTNHTLQNNLVTNPVTFTFPFHVGSMFLFFQGTPFYTTLSNGIISGADALQILKQALPLLDATPAGSTVPPLSKGELLPVEVVGDGSAQLASMRANFHKATEIEQLIMVSRDGPIAAATLFCMSKADYDLVNE